MIGLGTIINSMAIILGGLIGLFAGNKLSERFQKIIMVSMGLSVLSMAISGFVSKMIVIEDGVINTTGTYLIIFSLVFGAIFGELLNIDLRIEDFGKWLKVKTGSIDPPHS